MAFVHSDGSTEKELRKTIKEQLESLGQTSDQDLTTDCPPLAQNLHYIFHWFGELESLRRPSFTGLGRLTWSDIAAWCQVRALKLTTFERRAIIEVDAWRCYSVNSKQKKTDNPNPKN